MFVMFERRIMTVAGVVLAGALGFASEAGAAAWEERAVPGPSPRGEFGFAFDNHRDVAVLFGGSSDLTFTAVNRQTWEWNGIQWSLADTTGPTARCDNAMAYDGARGVVVSYGGYNGTYFADTWEYGGAGWTTPGVFGPGNRADAFMAFDSGRGVMVLFGGQRPGNILRDTWEYGGAWARVDTTGPSRRWIQRMAYDSRRGVTVMFGGAAPGSVVLGDTWEWNGTSWTQRSIPGPSPRYGQAMAFDSQRGVVLLFGGQSGPAFGDGVLGDTWEYDGTSWTQLPITGPTPRSFVKMVYDSARHRVVLFGGYDGTQMTGDTWELVPDATGVREPVIESGERPRLFQNSPNPFQRSTRIRYRLPLAGVVRLSIHDVTGTLVMRLVQNVQHAGDHEVTWNGRDARGRDVASGVYLCRLESSGQRATARMIRLH